MEKFCSAAMYLGQIVASMSGPVALSRTEYIVSWVERVTHLLKNEIADGNRIEDWLSAYTAIAGRHLGSFLSPRRPSCGCSRTQSRRT